MSGLAVAYGLEENAGIHIIFSNLIWWISVILLLIAYRYRKIWDVGFAPWTYLFSGFLFFAIRELGHFSPSDSIGAIRYLCGIWSGIFMTSAFALFYMILFKSKKISGIYNYLPLALSLIFLAHMIYLYFSGTAISDIRNTFNTLEIPVWMSGSAIIIYTTFMLGTRASGRFVSFFMFFQFSAYAAFTWKFLALIEKLQGSLPYYIREVVETLFGVFAIISIFLLTTMMISLFRDMHRDKIETQDERRMEHSG